MAGMTDSVSIRVPYKNLKREVEVEMMGVDESHSPQNHRIDLNSSPFSSPSPPSGEKHISLMTLVLSCTVAAGVQFGWALQLSLLTPYIQVHTLSLSLSLIKMFVIFFFLFIACFLIGVVCGWFGSGGVWFGQWFWKLKCFFKIENRSVINLGS